MKNDASIVNTVGRHRAHVDEALHLSYRGEAEHGPIAAEKEMKLRVGYELQYEFPQPTPVILMLNIHFTRVSDLATPDHIVVSPSVPISADLPQ